MERRIPSALALRTDRLLVEWNLDTASIRRHIGLGNARRTERMEKTRPSAFQLQGFETRSAYHNLHCP